MSTNPVFWQMPFDPAATFIVAGWLPGYTHRGEVPRKGAVFDKAGVAPDRLRGLYEARWIRAAQPGELPDPRVAQLIEGEEIEETILHGATGPRKKGRRAVT